MEGDMHEGRARARHRGLDAARVLGRDRGRHLPPARRCRDGPDRRARRRAAPGQRASSTWSAPATRAAASTPTCSSPTQGLLPVETARAAHVVSTRFEPELYVPPRPGDAVVRTTGTARDEALYFDTMEEKLVAGVARDRLPIYIDLVVPRRPPRRPREHLRDLRRRDQDDVRELPALRALSRRTCSATRRPTPRR